MRPAYPAVGALRRAALLLVAAASPATLPAQRADSLAAGARVRVFNARGDYLDATLVRVDSAGGLTLARPPRDTTVLGPRAVTAVQRYDGRMTARAAFDRGARRGAVVVGAVGVVAVAASGIYELRRGGEDVFGVPVTAIVAVGAATYTAVAAVVGGTIGLAFRDRWTRVRTPVAPRDVGAP